MASSPPPSAPGRITEILARIRAGEASADDLIPLVYDELRLLARRRLRRHGTSGTLQPTVLVHEAYLRLVGSESPAWENRAHFFAVAPRHAPAAGNHARDRAAGKRGGGRERVTLNDEVTPSHTPDIDLIALSQALERLEALDERRRASSPSGSSPACRCPKWRTRSRSRRRPSSGSGASPRPGSLPRSPRAPDLRIARTCALEALPPH